MYASAKAFRKQVPALLLLLSTHKYIYVCCWMLDIEHRKMSIAVVVATALCIWHKSASEHLHTYHAGALHCHDDIAYDDFACYSIVVVLALPRTRCGGGVNLASMGLMCVCEWRAECQILRVVEVFRQTQLDNSVASVGARDPKEISSTVINIRYLSRLLDTWHAIVDGGYFFFLSVRHDYLGESVFVLLVIWFDSNARISVHSIAMFESRWWFFLQNSVPKNVLSYLMRLSPATDTTFIENCRLSHFCTSFHHTSASIYFL